MLLSCMHTVLARPGKTTSAKLQGPSHQDMEKGRMEAKCAQTAQQRASHDAADLAVPAGRIRRHPTQTWANAACKQERWQAFCHRAAAAVRVAGRTTRAG